MIREPHEIRRRLLGCAAIFGLVVLALIISLTVFARSNPVTIRISWDGPRVKIRNYTGQAYLITHLTTDTSGHIAARLPEPLYQPSHVEETFIDPKTLTWTHLGTKEVVPPPTPGTRIFVVANRLEIQ